MDQTPPQTESLSPLKQAILEIRELRARLEKMQQERSEPVAIIGVGLRFPGGADDADSFWQLLRAGFDAITEIPPTRWSLADFYDPDVSIPGKMITRYGSFLPDIDRFDAAFFGISPREAISMDPQQRLLLETGWEALENAGQSPEKLLGSQTGVFIGISNSDYFRIVLNDLEKIDTYASTGGTLSVAAGRISYLLGLRGPAMSIDTACSSSLVAVHLACHSLRHKECDLALVGGSNLILTPEANINFSKAGMMALDGRCKTFDARADGYVRGEGCAMIVLKRLSDALADGDRILAVVRGSAVNQDGRSSGLTAPNGPSQEAVIRAALEQAGLAPGEVDYIEAHGTGTSLGDPIEVHALGAVFGPGRPASRPLQIGSVKTNVGHLEAAAGIAGLIKTALALYHREIPPHLHFETPNPHIQWEGLPLQVTTRLTPWQKEDGPLLAGISSFGFSGTNAHVILGEAPPQAALPAAPDARPRRLLTLSARSRPALQELAWRYEQALSAASDGGAALSLAALTLTANTGRSHFAHRLALTADSPEQARSKLAAFHSGAAPSGWWAGQAGGTDQPPVVFLFTGHGSHYVNMGRQLYETLPVFRRTMDACAEFLRPHLPRPLLSVLYPAEVNDQARALLDDMTYGQPAMFALEYALAMTWRSWGVEPAAVAGHSLGEYVAAAVSGVLRFEDALTLVAERGRLMQALPEDGEMVTVFAEESRVLPVIAPYSAEVSIAAVNSPETVVISGRRAAVVAVVEALKAQKIRTRRLNISRAAHSPLVEAMLPGIIRTSAGMRFSAPQIEFFSTVTGGVVSEALTRPEYWQRHLRQTVRFADAAQALFSAGYRTFLEIGPNPTLISLGQRSVPENEPAVWLPSLREGWTDWDQMLESVAQLYVSGAGLDWNAFEGDRPPRRLPLPTYAWERKSYWWRESRPAARPATPLWESAVAAGLRQAGQAPLELAVAAFPKKWQALNQLAALYIHNALVELGAYSRPGERHTPHSLLDGYAILPAYRALISRWLRLVGEQGWLTGDPDGAYHSPQPLSTRPVAEARQAVESLFADAPYVAQYVIECGERLASIVTGKESPLEMMFPGGSISRAEDLYQNWAHARYFNQIVAAVMESLAHANPGRELQALEIGAGTGATTSAVLPVLPPGRSRYFFTDVTELFLENARRKFAAYPFVRYGLLDIEKDGQQQGYGSQQFQAVIAANVIHATRSLKETLRNVRSLLAPEGVFILFEATSHQPWFDITTGLIEGWQSFADDDAEIRRADSPLLSAAQWEQVLRAEGFTEVVVLPLPGSPGEALGEHVILARPAVSDGAAQPGAISLETEAAPAAEAGQPPAAEISPADELLARLQAALPDERKELLLDFVRQHVISVLRLDPNEPPERRARLMDLGVDSLMAVELRGRLTNGLKLARKLPATLIFDYPTIEAITDFLLQNILTLEPAPAVQPAAPEIAPAPATAAEIEALSDDEVQAMLLEKLKKLK
jgi:acyl transferase domain-containing protein/SAM-dependent methyltransferase/acyl carrier protein